MKKLCKMFFLIGFAAFLAVSCDNGSADNGGGTGGGETDKQSEISVTPKENGIFVKLNYSKRNDSANWGHVKILVQDVTDPDNNWIAAVEAGAFDIETSEANGQGEKLPTEFLFPFVKKGNKYRVSYIHQDKDWSNYKNENDGDNPNYVTVTAIGGLGNINVSIDRDKFLFLSPEPMLYLPKLRVELPEVLKDVEAKWNVHAEAGGRWKAGKDKEFPYEGDFITGLESFNDNTFTLNGQTELYFNVAYTFKYEDVAFSQWVVNNDDRYFVNYDSTSSANHFPLIKINSTENEGSLDFVLEPIAKHVKEAAHSWGDYSNDVIKDPWYEDCDIYDGDTKIGSGQVKVRGNWTTSYAKKSLRIKFEEKQKMLGLHGDKKYKNWVLLADWKDASLLRNAVGLEMYRKFFPGYASECRLVEVEVNGEKLGVYLLAEQQEAKRLGLTEPEDNATNTDIGYLIEFDSYYYSENANEQFVIDYTIGDNSNTLCDYNGTTLIEPQSGYTIKSDINDKAQHDFITGYMNKLWEICYKAVYKKEYLQFDDKYDLIKFTGYEEGDDNDTKCKKCIEKIIDLGSLADTYIFNEFVCDPDLYLTSFFMNVDFAEGKDKKLYFNAPWDFDSTMGNKRFCTDDHFASASAPDAMFAGLCQTDVNGDYGNIHANPWMVIFIREAWFQNIVKDRYSKLNPSQVLSELKTYIDNNSTDAYQASFDYTRSLWNNPGNNSELCSDSSAAAKTSQKASAEYLKNWLTARFSAVSTIISSLAPAEN